MGSVCKAVATWCTAQRHEPTVEEVGVASQEDHPAAEDHRIADDDSVPIAEAGVQPVPFAFEPTGELGLFMRERRPGTLCVPRLHWRSKPLIQWCGTLLVTAARHLKEWPRSNGQTKRLCWVVEVAVMMLMIAATSLVILLQTN